MVCGKSGMVAQMRKKLISEEVRQFIAVLKEYSDQYQQCVDYINRVHKT
jgi:hypothetical protein